MPGLDLSSVTTFLEGFLLMDTVRISRAGSGPPVFNQETGEYDWPDGDPVYEGIGAVQVSGTPGGISTLPTPNLPWAVESRSKYVMFTPPDAPIAEKDMLISVTAVHPGGDLSLLGRQWRAQDPSQVGTISVIRVTGLDQVQQTRETS
ncbi:DUF6093 family protein [Streptomyces sp. NPDC007074]|uniref:DUF6093 family protein n=1 Tax=Streptomyces sp. NPDC007074 TaxID=3156764 RepID=UPI00340F395E